MKKMPDIKPENLFDITHTIAGDSFKKLKYPWEILPLIKKIILSIGPDLDNSYERMGEAVWVGKGTRISPSAYIQGPAIIGHDCDIRHCAFIRASVITGDNCVVGNSTELKNAVLFDNVQVPHFNYVGDSVMGYKSHLGAGVILSNVKSISGNIKVNHQGEHIDTGLRKFGAMIGDHVEIGCNAVIAPGSVIGRDCIVYPLTFSRGVLPESHILKNNGNMIKKRHK